MNERKVPAIIGIPLIAVGMIIYGVASGHPIKFAKRLVNPQKHGPTFPQFP